MSPSLRDTRFLRGVLVGSLATVLLAAAGLGWAWHLARSSDCAALPREDLSLREMGQLRRRLDAYKRSERPSPLILSGREASFLLREEFGLPAWLAVEGSEVSVQAQVGEEGRCWDLGFTGQVELEHSVARLRPSGVRIGRLDLSWLVRGRSFDVPVQSLPAEPPAPADDGGRQPIALRDLADHLLTMQVADGSVFVRVDDPGWIR
ncbi:MAG: hypothetical protein R3F59_03400 [Myxococcota bacterium]